MLRRTVALRFRTRTTPSRGVRRFLYFWDKARKTHRVGNIGGGWRWYRRQWNFPERRKLNDLTFTTFWVSCVQTSLPRPSDTGNVRKWSGDFYYFDFELYDFSSAVRTDFSAATIRHRRYLENGIVTFMILKAVCSCFFQRDNLIFETLEQVESLWYFNGRACRSLCRGNPAPGNVWRVELDFYYFRFSVATLWH